MVFRKTYVALVAVLLFLGGQGRMEAQTYLYFQDSPEDTWYDYSWMEVVPPSELDREMAPDLRKFPVESVIPAQQGVNSLRLTWRSLAGGNWFAIAAGENWTEKDISDTDSLVFWARSIEGIDSTDLPKIFLEDITNRKSVRLSLSDWSGDLAAGVWTRIAIPMSAYLLSGDGVDYTVIKTIGFAQNLDDGVEHTLLIDNMRVNKGNGSFPPVSVPQGVQASGYECHIEVSWDANPEASLSGYQVERSLDGGQTFVTLRQVNKDTRYYTDWVKDLGETAEAAYRVRALNEANDPSSPSDTVTGTTRTLTDNELLDMVQAYTFRYFWDFAHESSGMSRERNTSGDVVTSGGSGFGLMAIPVGIERGFITRQEGVDRTLKMLNFLATADRFHGAWSHWINGSTGKVIPFSNYDNGGDIVETSYMAQGLLTIRAYFDGEDAGEKQIVQQATDLWEGIEWDWYRKDGSPSIYWHWSPNYAWQMNMKVTGWNEAAIVYLLAIASPTYGVPATLWHTGWAGSPYYINGKSFYGHTLHVGWDYGGPLFFAQYSFLGFDPGDKADDYANYFDQNRNHSLVHHAYCIDNPRGFEGYSASCWGLTASDDPDGYMAHEPNSSRDNGTVTPTAALSSFPYTPEESMAALKHFYRNLGEKTWSGMGFLDAFNETRDWWADSYLAIDQGPILLMIENYRSRLLWDLFMSNPEIQPMMDAIGFRNQPNSDNPVIVTQGSTGLSVFPNPSPGGFHADFRVEHRGIVSLDIYNLLGEKVFEAVSRKVMEPGNHRVEIGRVEMPAGIYMVRLTLDGHISGAVQISVTDQ